MRRAEFAASRISGCRRRLTSMRQLCRIVSNAPGMRCIAGAGMASSISRFRTIEIGPGIALKRTVSIHTDRLDGETATNGRRVGMSGCSANKYWAVGLHGVVACFASRIVRWVQFPHGPPNSPAAYARSIRSAENFREASDSLPLAPSGNGVLRCIRALGARGLSSILSSPTKDLRVRARED